ncbi:MAG: hypothetical protein A3H98_04840 [Bacteroidetes bacterium RIFCSPLOWO2_02_FULL_36_8]|nr:MAG: hypothetical protein A3H98_04840 [Bacteroidetes bacterium RIFCSPLOWO2_02_FULL_36_8]OFY70694.1 MAG: hypothetical protein A3G23_08225 [Bacteroidetes bacterium RIFCSPLOWO2_12_FULL_37_12]
MNKKKFPFILLLILTEISFGQGRFSGDLMLNSNFYKKDTSIGATTTQYLRELYSTDAWLRLNYSINDFDFSLRYDLFQHSALFNPKAAYTGQGFGFWSIRKKINKLQITGGYFYEQFGSGSVFRAYENRGLGIDNALQGIHLKYELTEKLSMKAFTGQQKTKFSLRESVISGGNIEKFTMINETFDLLTGGAYIDRTMDDNSFNMLISNIESMPDTNDRFIPKKHAGFYTFYNTLRFKDISWYAEYSGKSKEAILDLTNKLVNKDGNMRYTSLTYAREGFALDFQYKRTENFIFRTSPDQLLLDGVINFLPPMNRTNSYRLLSRYNPGTRPLSENAYQVNLATMPIKGMGLNFNFTDIYDLNKNHLFREIQPEIEIKNSSQRVIFGVQLLQYSQEVYEGAGKEPWIRANSPFIEYIYRITKKHSIRSEFQYMMTKEDYKDWVYGLLEYNISPKYSLFASDMYNNSDKNKNKTHYYNLGGSLTLNATKFYLAYVRQVQGIVCTGGICRLEPAFNGLKFSLVSSF